MHRRAEFTSEPFVGEGEPTGHVLAAAQALRAAGLDCDIGPLGTSVSGESDLLLPPLNAVLESVFASGAIRFTLQVDSQDDGPDPLDQREFPGYGLVSGPG